MSSQSSNSKQKFCALAWVHSFVNLGGEYQVCCTSEEYNNDIRDENGKVYNVADTPQIKTVMNSKFMKDLRVQMLKGELPELCTRCKVTEQMMGASRRIIENKSYEHIKEELISNTTEDGEIKNLNILSSDYRLGNHCNLQCRMCNPRATKKWIKDWLHVNPKSNVNERSLEVFKNYNWYESDNLIDEVSNKSQSINHLHFGGGEPLLSPRMRDILQVFIENKRSSEIVLTYNTNITKLPKQVLELWPYFKEVRLLVSIDAFGELNDYIRPPSVWADVDKNLRYLNDNTNELKITQIMLNTTVQAYNILGLKELCDYLEGFENVIKLPNFILLHYPHHFQANVLSDELKEQALKDLNLIFKRNLPRIPENLKYLLENVFQVKSFLKIEPSNQAREEFIEVTRKLDEIHHTSSNKVIPKLFEVPNK